jgi:hypothetical protein
MKTYLGLYFTAKYIGNERPGALWKFKPALIKLLSVRSLLRQAVLTSVHNVTI